MENREQKIVRVTLLGMIVNVLLTIGKLVAAGLGNSAAMLADGIHSLSDLISDVVVLCFVKISGKEKDNNHKYGHGKYETLATLIVSVLLMIVAVRLLVNGILNINVALSGEASLEKPGWIALIAAVVSVLAKEVLYQVTRAVGKSVESPVVVANAWHHRTDSFSSIASAIGIGFAIGLGGQWIFLDNLVCCAISIFIMVVAVKMALPALSELLEASLPEQDEQKIIRLIKEVEGVENVHELKTRRNGPHIIIDVHVVVDSQMTVQDAHDITIQAEESLRSQYGDLTQISMHVEPHEDAL